MPGLIDFTAGQVLTAAQMDTLMQQCIIAVPSGSYPTTVHEGMTVYDQTENRYYSYNGGWVRTSLWTNAAGRTGCWLRRTNPQTISNSVATAVAFDTENRDSDGYIAVTGSTVTIPAGLGGLYSLGATSSWGADPASGGPSYLEIAASGEVFRSTVVGGGAIPRRQSVSAGVIEMGVGDTVVVNVFHSTVAGSISLSDAKLWLYRVGV